MSLPPAGASKTGLFSKQDYLSPLPIPTGEKPIDMLNIVWRKNDVFLDVGSYSIGSGVMVLWSMIMLFVFIAYIWGDTDALWVGVLITIIPTMLLIYTLLQPTPLPIRFNRQRREVCVPRDGGEYWIVQWESVTAAASQQSSVSQTGKNTMGMLFIGFDNPNSHADEDNKHYFWGFNCGGGEAAMALWECMRSYMEVGPEAVVDQTARFHRPRGILATYATVIVDAANKRGWFLAVLWEGFFGIFIFNVLLAQALERLKLNPPPGLTYPDIIEWSKPLPPEQWAKRSPELEAAISQREAELATREG